MSDLSSQNVRDAIIAKLGNEVRFSETPEDEGLTRPPPSPPTKRVSTLEPPQDANYWRSQAITVMETQKIRWLMDVIFGHEVWILLETLTWRIDAYVYTANARPGKTFAEEGGRVYVVLFHYGSARMGELAAKGLEYRYNVTMISPPPDSAAISQLPPLGNDIEFCQDMQMFKDNGNEIFTFRAQLEESLGLRDGEEQRGFLNDIQGTQWAITSNDPKPYDNFPFMGLSVFCLPQHGLVSFGCEASVHEVNAEDSTTKRLAYHTQVIEIDCRF
ncbi:hypothetical protein ONZ45_g14430 [Pleurotus djamor]|nr:hypothetical protein ONZ45_g14430 [Pleurotus djamor]